MTFLLVFLWGYLEYGLIKLTRFFFNFFYLTLIFVVGSFFKKFGSFLSWSHITSGGLVKLTHVDLSFSLRHYFSKLIFSSNFILWHWVIGPWALWFFFTFLSVGLFWFHISGRLLVKLTRVNLNCHRLHIFFFCYVKFDLTRGIVWTTYLVKS